MLHRLAHWIGWSFGNVVTALDDYGRVWIGFKCVGCGRVSGVRASYKDAPQASKFK